MATGVDGANGAHVHNIVALVTKLEQELATVRLQLTVAKIVPRTAQPIRLVPTAVDFYLVGMGRARQNVLIRK